METMRIRTGAAHAYRLWSIAWSGVKQNKWKNAFSLDVDKSQLAAAALLFLDIADVILGLK